MNQAEILKYLADTKVTRPIVEIIDHCTATPAGREVSLATIRKWHVVDNGWSDIGYHFVLALDGTIWLGRPLNTVGSHVAGHNTGTIGISYVGGTDDKGNALDTRTDAQKASFIWLQQTLINKFPTIKKISGHRDYAAKACPSFDATKEYAPLLSGKPAVTADPKLPIRTAVSGFATVKATLLNVRSAPNTNGSIVAQLPQGSKVQVFGRDGDWLKIEGIVKGAVVSGWASSQFILKSE